MHHSSYCTVASFLLATRNDELVGRLFIVSPDELLLIDGGAFGGVKNRIE
jgi:hypothetical protein